MITEDYVSFETAKHLKEKGFNERISHWYDDEEFLHKNTGLYLCNSTELDGCITAPTIQMAMKWLRQTYNIHVVPKFDFYAGDYTGRIYDGRRETALEQDDYIAIVGYKTHSEAADAAIRYCLENLI